VLICVELSVRSEVVQLASGVIGSSSERVAIREESTKAGQIGRKKGEVETLTERR
jgi:hypothetical protein